MGFMNSYKRLDNLCRDMNGVGVTGYIDDMKNEPKGSFCVLGWQADFNQLRKYRHIRNRIAHENDVDEAQVCSDRDIAWLENFYQRIINKPIRWRFVIKLPDLRLPKEGYSGRMSKRILLPKREPTQVKIPAQTVALRV